MIPHISSLCVCVAGRQMAAQCDVWKDAWRCWQRAAGPLPASITPLLSIFPSLHLICLLKFLSAQLFKKKKNSPYFTSFSPSALPSFVFLPIRLSSSYFPLLLSFFCNTTCLFISSAALSSIFSPPLPWLVCFCLPFVCPCRPSRKSLAVSCLHWSVSLGS